MMQSFFIHPTAIADEGVLIGTGSKVWHFSHLMPFARVGEQCNLGQNVFIDREVIIGNRVKIQNNVSVYHGVTIADDVFIGPSVVFTNVYNPRSFVERKHEMKPTAVGRGTTIGANATILCGITLGPFTFVGAGAVVLHDTVPHEIVVGNPAKSAGWMSEFGYKLKFGEEGRAWCEEEQCFYVLSDRIVRKQKG